MTKEKNEVLKVTPFETFTEKNGNLKRYLNLALKNTREIMKLLLPKIAVEVRNVIQSCIDVQKTKCKQLNQKN